MVALGHEYPLTNYISLCDKDNCLANKLATQLILDLSNSSFKLLQILNRK